ncbi:GGDEF domain-containing protein [Parahaliea aestuarii]|uniref:Diguanylate cyclase n=1 Tax=Parahaliea aestuarii TaxID=1852021 RepID=A0A5C8ZYB3_9GAMM|nr:diguanylate cyclase [Parahaliea aestuarii]TXS93565.1 diguanylate cyclase [Parahaliea aestuarii]
MSSTTRTRLAAVAVILLGSLLLAAFCAQHFYQQSLDQVRAVSKARLDQRADLQWLIYQQQTPALQRLLQDLTRHPAIDRGHIYSGTGDHLASHPAGGTVALDTVRGQVSLNEAVLQGIGGDGNVLGSSYFSTLLHPGARLHLNLPVITRLNPDAKNLNGQDFLQAMTSASRAGSDIVMGFVDLAIDPAVLRRESLPQILAISVGWLVLAGILALLMLSAGVRQALQLHRTTGIIDRLANGEREIEITQGGGEIDAALRRLVHSLGRYSREIETGKSLLSRKVEERTHQLSRSHEELHRASEAVSESRQRLQRLTYYDHLTTLPNRQLFLEQLGLLLRLSRRAGQHLALLHVDLANFRQINEVQGYHAGDLLLREVARRLKQCVRDSDAVATAEGPEHDISVSRLGGDEFTVVLNDLDKPESARLVAERLVSHLQAPLAVGDSSVTVQTRVGIACFPEHGDSAETLLRAAAIALNRAKSNPGLPVMVCRDEWLANPPDNDDAPWREALQQQTLALRYTPVVDTVMGSVVCLHATLCRPSPASGDAAAATPLQIWNGRCSDSALAKELDTWRLQQASTAVARLSAGNRQPPRVALPLPPNQCSADLPRQIQAVLAETALPPAQLELCLDESVLAEGRFGPLLNELRDLGLYLSVTDFGLGATSLQQLGESDLRALYIAPAFAPRYTERSDSGTVRALAGIARSLDLEPVAGGVASAVQYHFLAALGVRLMSGDLFGQHLEEQQAAKLLAPWHFIEQIRKLGTEQ